MRKIKSHFKTIIIYFILFMAIDSLNYCLSHKMNY